VAVAGTETDDGTPRLVEVLLTDALTAVVTAAARVTVHWADWLGMSDVGEHVKSVICWKLAAVTLSEAAIELALVAVIATV
jgi:hypothetical protein